MRTLFPGRMLVVAIALLLAGGAPAHAQLRADLFTGGVKVRVTTPDLPRERTVGRVSHVAADTLYLTHAGELSALPLKRISAVEVNEGVNLARGIVRGAAAGAVVGALAFGIHEAAYPSEGEFQFFSGRDAIVAQAVFGGLLGATAGIPVGVLVEKRRWSLAWSSRTR